MERGLSNELNLWRKDKMDINAQIEDIDLQIEILQLKREKLQLTSQPKKEIIVDDFGFEVVKSGSGCATIMPNGIRLSHSKCTPYKSISVEKDGKIKAGKLYLPLTVDEIVKFNKIKDSFPNGNKERAVWCEKHFNKQFTIEPIVYNIFIGTFDNLIKEPIVILGE